MARFDFYEVPGSVKEYFLDVQADLLSYLETRIVVPMIPADRHITMKANRLNPIFDIQGTSYLLMTPVMSVVHRSVLTNRVGTLASEHHSITDDAIDFLLQGF